MDEYPTQQESALPPGSEPWTHLTLRWFLKLPLGPVVNDFTIEEVRYLKYAIEHMENRLLHKNGID